MDHSKSKSPAFAMLCAGWAISLLWALPVRAQPIVAVDAGHTESAQGAKAAVDGRSELFFNLDLSRAIAVDLAARGVHPRMANDPPRQREDFKARAGAGQGASLFVSVHHDSAKTDLLEKVREGAQSRWEDTAGRFKGFALFVDPADAKGLACAKLVGARLEEAGERPSLYHADPAMGEPRELLDAKLGVHAFPGLALERLRKAPMFLLEAGVIVNPQESLRLRLLATRERMAAAVADGVAECLAPGPDGAAQKAKRPPAKPR